MNGAAIALIGVAVGAVLAFSFAQLGALLGRRRRGRVAARLIWFELMKVRATVRKLKTGGAWIGDRPFVTQTWDTERSAFTEVADGYAFGVVALAYNHMTALQEAYEMLAGHVNASQSEGSSLEALTVEYLGPQTPPSIAERCFDAIEEALVQLDRYSGLTKRPVDYAELDRQSGVSR